MGLRQYISQLKNQYNQEDLPEFELQRKRLAQQIGEQGQTQREQLTRQFARLGGGPAGAQIKVGQQLEEQLGKAREAGEEQISAQELAMRRNLAEAEKQRKYATGEREASQLFARGEREAGQGFMSAQNQAQREFARAEREASQLFGRGEREGSQAFVRAEREGQQQFQKQQADIDQAFKERVFAFDSQSKLRELDLAKETLDLEKNVAQFNTEMAKLEAAKPTDLMGSLFGPQFSTSAGRGGIGALATTANLVTNPVLSGFGGFCFLENTLIDLEENVKIRVQDLKIGDSILEGGAIYFTGASFCSPDEIYYYNGVLVTGDHAVLDGEWKRVKDSENAKKVKFLEPQKVYFLSCENHRIIVNGNVFADFDEVDGGDALSDEECLTILNQNLLNNKE